MKDKTCLICHTAIDTDKEYFSTKHHKNKNEIISKAYYHIECFRNRILGVKAQQNVANKATEILNKIAGKLE